MHCIALPAMELMRCSNARAQDERGTVQAAA